MDWLTKLNLKGYRYNPNQTDNVNGFYYDSVDSDDDWIEIVRDSGQPLDVLIILTVKEATTQKIETFFIHSNLEVGNSTTNLENWINLQCS